MTDTPVSGSEDFAERMFRMWNEATLALMVSVGHRTGLFDTMATLPASTSAEVAASAGLDERYVREWLAAMTTGRIVDYDSDRRTFSLPADRAAWLTRSAGLNNLATGTRRRRSRCSARRVSARSRPRASMATSSTRTTSAAGNGRRLPDPRRPAGPGLRPTGSGSGLSASAGYCSGSFGTDSLARR